MWVAWTFGIALLIAGFFAYFGTSPTHGKKSVKNNPPPQRLQITLFHVLWLSFIFTCAFFAGRTLAVYWGKWGWVAGGLIGITCVFLLLYALWLLAELYYRFRPLRPTCRRGKCQADEYEIKVVVKEGSWESENRCKCGDTYVRRGKRSMLLGPDGSTQPYMLRRPYHNWEPDN
jgi:hypothetical protein